MDKKPIIPLRFDSGVHLKLKRKAMGNYNLWASSGWSALHGNHLFTVESSKKELYLSMVSTVDLTRSYDPLSVRCEIRESAEKGKKSVAHWVQVSPSAMKEMSVFYVTEGCHVFVEE